MATDNPESVLKHAGVTYKTMCGGREARFNCPVCGDDEGFNLNLRSGLWGCRRASCGSTGNLYQLKVHLGLAYEVRRARVRPEDEPRARLKRIMAARQQADPAKWQQALWVEKAAAPAREYLRGRGFTTTSLHAAHVGWIPRHPNSKRKGQQANGLITLPYFAQPGDKEAVNVKLRFVPPEPVQKREGKPDKVLRYMKIAGGDGILYAPLGFDPTGTVLLVGGELDCLSVIQALFNCGFTLEGKTIEAWREEVGFSVVSVPDGEGNSELWSEQLATCEDVVVAFDSDEGGRAGAMKAAARLGKWRARVSKGWPGVNSAADSSKDANAALVVGALDILSLQAMVNSAPAAGVDGLVQVADIAHRVMAAIYDAPNQGRGWSTGWSVVDEAIGGWSPRGVTGLTAGTGCGKTTWAFQALLYQRAQGRKVLLFPFEGGVDEAMTKLVWQHLGRSPYEATKQDTARAICELLPGLYLFDHYGTVDPDQFNETLRYCVLRLGIEFVVVDHLHFMVNRSDPQKHAKTGQIMMYIKHAMRESGAHAVVCMQPHSVKGDKGASADDVIIQIAHIKGESTLSEDCDVIISLYRPRNARRSEVLNDDGTHQAAGIVTKLRQGQKGKGGDFALRFDKDADRYLDPDW